MGWHLRQVWLQYRRDNGLIVDALRGVTLEIEPGERLALVGSNGSGKSALALCLTRLLRPTRGEVVVTHGGVSRGVADPVSGDAALSGCGAIAFQYPDDNLIAATVEEEIVLTLAHSGGDPDAGPYLELLGLSRLRHRQVAHLSGGEKQSLAVAAAIAAGRDLIVLDEPTSHLDPPGRKNLLSRLLELDPSRWPLSYPQPAVVLVTQYPEEAARFPRVVELSEGLVVYDGPAAAWRETKRPRTPRPGVPTSQERDRPVVLQTCGLAQQPQPGWPLPPFPLAGIDVCIYRGEGIGVCGPIGSGKSTLLYHLAGLIDTHTGSVDTSGGDEANDSPVVLIQFPERQLFAERVLDDVSYGPVCRGVPRERAQSLAGDALARIGLPPHTWGRHSPFALSGGQRRRVAIAGVLACEASLYLLDEPTGALDESGVRRLEDVLQVWRSAGIAYVIVSHDLEWLSSVTSRLWVMQEGRVSFDGPWSDQGTLPGLLKSIGFVE